jgi:hypothetical protein
MDSREGIKRHGSLNNMGAAQFEIVLEPHEVRLVIHGSYVVARTKANVYGELFDHCKKVIEQSE